MVDFENRYLTKDGTYRWLCWRASSAPERGLIYAVARDIEEQKQIEEMKNDFVSVVSHELRTPLTSIRGALGLLAGGVAGELPEKARTLLDIASKNSDRLGRLINDILDIEKIESGKMGFRFAPQEVMALLELAVESNRSYATAYEVELRLAGGSPGLRVWADADRFQQVVANLLSNACKFSPRGGVVEIAAARQEDGRVLISVTNRGRGIPPEPPGAHLRAVRPGGHLVHPAEGGNGARPEHLEGHRRTPWRADLVPQRARGHHDLLLRSAGVGGAPPPIPGRATGCGS